jgi:hypothetical protein
LDSMIGNLTGKLGLSAMLYCAKPISVLSALGRHDGRAYDGLLAAVKTEPLNRTEVTRAYKVRVFPLICSVLTMLIRP